ncbi:hypothetical protein KY359_02950 [Candidatus Woesearchaeota archaeon]|nr:hypothetical protein [Candidatus Woesearchaeota archaeon]
MNNKTILITASILLIIASILSSGCKPDIKSNITVSPSVDENINPITGEKYYDLPEKRGVQTNITDFNELLRRASAIEGYKYNLTDTALGIKGQQFFVLGRFVKTRLPEVQQQSTGEQYDEVFMERRTKQAFSHCSKYLCPSPDIDKEIERVEYSDYYVNDPYEYISKATHPQFVKEEMIGNQYTKVFDVRFEGKDARVWVQEYYGFPIKILVRDGDEISRTIKFEDMMVDATRRGEIDLPFNFTISGEKGQWYFWEHYLGEWPPKGSDITIPTGGEPVFRV